MESDRPIPVPHGFGLEAAPADLATQVGELQTRLEALARETEDAMRRARSAVDRVQQADAKIGSLEQLLTAAHEREEELTAQLRIERTKSDGPGPPLEPPAPAVTGELDAAERRANEATHRAELLDEQLLAAGTERDTLRNRAAELRMHLSIALSEASTAASERARADRIQAERDAARAQAEAERRLTIASQTRATRAEARLAVLESPMLAADRRLAEATKTLRGVLLGKGGDEPDRVVDISDHATLDVDPKNSEGTAGW